MAKVTNMFAFEIFGLNEVRFLRKLGKKNTVLKQYLYSSQKIIQNVVVDDDNDL